MSEVFTLPKRAMLTRMTHGYHWPESTAAVRSLELPPQASHPAPTREQTPVALRKSKLPWRSVHAECRRCRNPIHWGIRRQSRTRRWPSSNGAVFYGVSWNRPFVCGECKLGNGAERARLEQYGGHGYFMKLCVDTVVSWRGRRPSFAASMPWQTMQMILPSRCPSARRFRSTPVRGRSRYAGNPLC